MMFSKLKSCGLLGIDGFVVEVEADISNGIPAFEIVGLADTAIRESKERVRSAIKNAGLEFPVRRITMNLAPANLKKVGSSFDLAIALGILAATEQVTGPLLTQCIFVGELSLDGEIRPIHGVLPIAVSAMQSGAACLVLPEANAKEAAVVRGLKILPVKSLSEAVRHFNGQQPLETLTGGQMDIFNGKIDYAEDFSDVKGQENVKRALEVAASGAHNCIMLGY